jgi:aminoglycoside/choline kinase family phosphotransferase
VTDSSLPAAITTCLARFGMTGSCVTPLTPDASDRRYYRVQAPQGPSAVLALHTGAFEPGSLPFSTVSALFAAMPLPVPRVRHEAADLGILILDDLGDVTLQARTESAPDSRHLALYERAVEHLAVLQRRGAELADARLLPYTLAFDLEKLMWEMDFCVTHFLEGFRGLTIASPARTVLREELETICGELATEPRVLCHRDYHSRNLMVTAGDLFIIDFQDARMGPNTYDLVSLLRDSYVDIPAGMFDHLTMRFRAAIGDTADASAFAARFDLMSVQRNLKALGTFGYQAVSRANPAYAQYVPRTLDYVRRAFERQPRFARLRSVLAPLVTELA